MGERGKKEEGCVENPPGKRGVKGGGKKGTTLRGGKKGGGLRLARGGKCSGGGKGGRRKSLNSVECQLKGLYKGKKGAGRKLVCA